jgi:hypothetical protein
MNIFLGKYSLKMMVQKKCAKLLIASIAQLNLKPYFYNKKNKMPSFHRNKACKNFPPTPFQHSIFVQIKNLLLVDSLKTKFILSINFPLGWR